VHTAIGTATIAEAARACGFEILRPLGSGGMASVFLAMDTKLQRPVALKFPNTAGRQSNLMKDLLKREAENAASLIHENIVQVYSWHEHGGYLFFAMELVEGETLLERVKSGGPLNPVEALRIAMECANGLAAAHRRGIIHHDIKPANIMIRNDGRIKVADLGISTTSDERSKLVQQMMVRGTVGYMAPEQARGEVVTPASDVYSLGITLYYALSGKAAYVFHPGMPKEDRLKVNQAGQIRPLQEVMPNLPRTVLRLVDQMLQPAPSRRLATMPLFVQAARKVFLGLETPPATFVGRSLVRLGHFVSAMKLPLAVVAGAAGGVVATAGYYEANYVSQQRLTASARDAVRGLAEDAAKLYARHPNNGQIGTAVAPVIKAASTQDWLLALRGIGLLHSMGMIQLVPPTQQGLGNSPQQKSSRGF
jgi:serine/threonine protein kinase